MQKSYQQVSALLIVFLLVAGPAVPVAAQTAASPAAPVATASSPADLNQLADELNDPTARAKLIDQLHLLASAAQKVEPEKAPPVETFGSKLLQHLSEHIDDLSDELGGLGQTFADFPRFWHYINHQMDDPATRAAWLQLGSSLLFVISSGMLGYGLLKLAVRPSTRRLRDRPLPTLWQKSTVALLQFILHALPVGAFAACGYLALAYLKLPDNFSIVSLQIVDATILFLGLLAIMRTVLTLDMPSVSFLGMSNEAALYLYKWMRAMGAAAFYGYFLLTAAGLLGLPHSSQRALMKIGGLIVSIMLIILILQNRHRVTAWMLKERTRRYLRLDRLQTFTSLRRVLARIWHVFAVLYVVIVYLVWTFNVQGGSGYILHATGSMVLLLLATRIVVMLIDTALDRGLTISADMKQRVPSLERRANRYIPILSSIVHLLALLAVIIGTLAVWGVDSLSWISWHNPLVAKSLSVGLIIVIATVIWEVVAGIIERLLMGGGQGQRSARVRTLLPLMQNAFLIFLLIIAGLIILSEIGVNTGPLLAGAGVIGVAIGFGSQSLVKDVITGMFILFENTIAIGDVIDTTKHAGVVEGMSIRSIKIRDGDGALRTVPFSDITAIINSSRDYSIYTFDIHLNYHADLDKAMAAIRTLGKQLAEEPAYSAVLTGPFDIWGVDGFKDNGISIKGTFRTRPNQQWGLAREFNHRLKYRFDELDIKLWPAAPANL